jgi:hypothetical protein
MTTCSLFLHHRNDAVTRDHFERLKHFSNGPVIAVSSAEPLSGGDSIEQYPISLWQSHVEQRPHLRSKATDLLFLDWYRNRSIDADRYVVFEWDTLVNCPIENWFSDVACYPLAAPSVRLQHREPDWFRRHLKNLPLNVAPLATGMVPFTCVAISQDAIKRIEPLYNHDLQGLAEATGELRLPTLAAFVGITPVAIPQSSAVTWKPFMPVGLADTIYHPVKRSFVDPEPWMSPEEIQALLSAVKPHFHVLEFGSGRSSFWLAKHVARVTTVEHDANWLRNCGQFPANVEMRYMPPAWPADPLEPAMPGQFDDYVSVGDDLSPDLVLVDGRARVEVCKRWASRCVTLLHDANRSRYSELNREILAGSLARIRP